MVSKLTINVSTVSNSFIGQWQSMCPRNRHYVFAKPAKKKENIVVYTGELSKRDYVYQNFKEFVRFKNDLLKIQVISLYISVNIYEAVFQ